MLIFQKWKNSYWEWKIIIVNIKKKPSYVDKNGVFLISRNNDNIEKDENIVKNDENDTQKNEKKEENLEKKDENNNTEKDENLEIKKKTKVQKKKKNLLLKKPIVENLLHVSHGHFKTT